MGDTIRQLEHLLVPTTTIDSLAAEFIQYNRDIELSESTVKTRETHMKQFVAVCKEACITDVTIVNNLCIDRYFTQYRATHTVSTTNTSKRIMRAFLIWARDYKEINLRATPELIRITKDRNKLPQSIDKDIIRHVMNACDDQQDRLIIAVFIETGIRISELCALRIEDIRGDEISIQGKGLVDRTVQVTDRLAAALRLYTHDRTGYVFINKHQYAGDPMRKDTVWRHVKKQFKTIAGIDMHPHQLRHTFAISLLESGCDLVTIKELMGHEDINTTMQYLRVTNKFVKKEYKKHFGQSYLA